MKKITLLIMLVAIPFMGMAQTFDFNNTDDGWNVLSDFTATTNATYMTLTSVAGDGTKKNPYFGTTTAGVDTTEKFWIGITLRNNDASGPKLIRVSYPKTGGDPNKRVYKEAEITNNDSDFVTYWIELKNKKNWIGTMNDIRIHFKNAGNTDYILPTTPVSIDIDKIEFTANPPTTEQHVYEFDTDNDTEGWEQANGTISGPANGYLTFAPTADKFAKIKQLAHHVDASQYSRVHITLKNLSTNDDALRFVFNGDAANPVDQVISTSDSDFVTYDIDLSGSPAWTGDVMVTIGFRDQDNANGEGKSSGTGDFLIDRIEFTNTTLSVNNKEIKNLRIYPNPAKDFINIQTDEPITQITIFDVTGKKVLKLNNPKKTVEQINISHLNAGIYLIKIQDVSKNTSTRKLVKTK